MSVSSTRRLLKGLGNGHDQEVLDWRDSIVKTLSPVSSSIRLPVSACQVHSSDEESSDSEPELSPLFSPLASDDEDSDDEDDEDSDDESSDAGDCDDEDSDSEEFSDEDPRIDEDENMDTINEESMDCSLQPHQATTSISSTESGPNTASITSTSACPSFKIVGDNIDKNVKRRYLRIDQQNASLHFFHSFAVQDRIDFSHLSDTLPLMCSNKPAKVALELLPTDDDDSTLEKLFQVHVSRILATHMNYFSFSFEDVVEKHIEHDYHREMSTKSTVVPLGVLPYNENKNDEMVLILTHLHQYVPKRQFSEEMVLPSGAVRFADRSCLHNIVIGGDQLTAARSRGAKRTMKNASDRSNQLTGFVPAAEDFHTKMNLLDVIWKYFYSTNSHQEFGTLYQIRNLVNRSNVNSLPVKNFNSCDDFFRMFISASVLAATMEMLEMTSLSCTPSEKVLPDGASLWTKNKEERKSALDGLAKQVIDKFICFRYNNSKNKSAGDKVYQYHTRLLSLGLFYLEYSDAIKEGDGNRVVRCWRYLLPIFKSSERKNYSIESLHLLCQLHHGLPPRQSAQLVWDRFINTQGLPGGNIPTDLHMEHLNRLAKEAIGRLGSNKTKEAITCVGKVLGTLSPLLDQFDKENHVPEHHGSHRPTQFNKDCNIVVRHLKQSCVFTIVRGRTLANFPAPRDVLFAKKHSKIQEWIINHL